MLDLDLMQIIATLIMGVGVPLAVQILLQVWPAAPVWLKTIAPIILVPLLLLAGQSLTSLIGFPVDFGPIIDIIAGGAALGAASSVAFKMGKKKGKLA